MEQTENQTLFSELTAEELETVNGASYRRRYGYNSGYIYSSPRRRYYQQESSRCHNYRHNQGTVGFSVLVRFSY